VFLDTQSLIIPTELHSPLGKRCAVAIR